VRVALSKQVVASGGVDRLFDEVLPAGAEDFDQAPGVGEDVEIEVRVHTHTHCHIGFVTVVRRILPM
jgi:hypothetical protein